MAEAHISYITFSPDTSSAATCELPASTQSPREASDALASVPPFVTFHTLILDMSGVSFVDLMGIKALAKVSPHSCPLPSGPHLNQLREVPDPRDSLTPCKQGGHTLQGQLRALKR